MRTRSKAEPKYHWWVRFPGAAGVALRFAANTASEARAAAKDHLGLPLPKGTRVEKEARP